MLKVLAASTSLALAAAFPAVASVVTVTFTGTITTGYDSTQYFASGPDLTDQAITVSYTYDTATGQHEAASDFEAIYGGTNWGIPSPIFETTTIGGTSVTSGNVSALAIVSDSIYGSTAAYRANDFITVGSTSIDSEQRVDCIGAPGDIPANLSTAFAMPSYGCTGVGSYLLSDPSRGISDLPTYYEAAFDTVSFVVTDVAPVPLPAGVGLLGSGLAVLAAKRRRKAKIA